MGRHHLTLHSFLIHNLHLPPSAADRSAGAIGWPQLGLHLVHRVKLVSFGVVLIVTRSETVPRKPERVSEVGIELATARTFRRPRRLI